MWISMRKEESAVILLGDKEVSIPFSELADGCVGCMLVFEKKKWAKAFGGKGCQVVKLEEV